MAARREFVSIRFRLYFLLVLIPVGVFVLVRDLAGLTNSLSEPVAIALALAGICGMIVFFPFLILLVWKNSALADKELERQLIGICRQNRLGISRIRVWKTGNQVINAVVVGFVPRLRMILLSDGLLRQFESSEIEAVLRHEAGHIRLWHLPTRMIFMLLPLVALAIGDPVSLKLSDATSLSSTGLLYLLVLSSYGVYLSLVIRWLSHQMEHEADMYSIRADLDSMSGDWPVSHERVEDMKNATATPGRQCPCGVRAEFVIPPQYPPSNRFSEPGAIFGAGGRKIQNGIRASSPHSRGTGAGG